MRGALSWLVVACVSTLGIATLEVLTDESFEATVDQSSDLWLVDFYAPWCHACKHLDPILNEAAEASSDLMHIGKVDVTVNTKLQSQFEIVRYPTLMYRDVLDGKKEWKMYKGDRSVEAFITFARRMSGHTVKVVKTNQEIDNLFPSEESVIVLSQANDLETTHSKALEQDYYQIASQYRGQHLYLVIPASHRTDLMKRFPKPPSTSFVARLDATGHVEYYQPEASSLDYWIQANGYPTLAALSNENFRTIGMSHELLVVACLDPSDAAHALFQGVIAGVASTTKFKQEIAFGWLDSVRYDKYLTKFYIYQENTPSYFVWNMKAHVFYDAPKNTVINVSTVNAHLASILQGNEGAIRMGFLGYPYHMYRVFIDNYPVSVFLSIPVLFLVIVMYLVVYAWKHGDDAHEAAVRAKINNSASNASKQD